MESYEKLKAFDEEKGRCCNLITNEYVVAQYAVERGAPAYVLLYDKKTLLNPKTTVEEVRTQRIEIQFPTWAIPRMSINTTTLVFAVSRGQNVWDLRVLNFWVEREALGVNEDRHENDQAEQN